MKNGQAIRPSQFITTYGVGSIVLTENGPHVIKRFNDWKVLHSVAGSSSLISREILDQSASLLLEGGRIFQLPTNADVPIPDDMPLVRCLLPFPRWALCSDHKILYELGL